MNIRPIDLEQSPFLDYLLEQGNKFESKALETINPNQIKLNDTLTELKYPKHIRTDESGLLSNSKLLLKGIPDLLRTVNGRLMPIEIKNHKEVQRTDRTELAFYNILLEPKLKMSDFNHDMMLSTHLFPFLSESINGYIILNNLREEPIKLTMNDCMDAIELINNIRKVEMTNIEPCITKECNVCSLKQECTKQLKESASISLIWGMGYNRVHQFNQIGISTLQQLADANSDDVLKKLNSIPHPNKRLWNCGLGINNVKDLQMSAISWINQKPIMLSKYSSIKYDYAKPLNDSSDYIVLDLEYTPSIIFLIGLAIHKHNSDIEYIQLFANDSNEMITTLMKLEKILIQYPSFPIVTYSGTSADIPFLRKTMPNQETIDSINTRHMDLFQMLIQTFRFPIKEHGLKSIGNYLGYERKLPDTGMDALLLYYEYQESKNSSKKSKIKHELEEYNKEDLDAVIFVMNELYKLQMELSEENNESN
jgi:predicted RecB family nuclease